MAFARRAGIARRTLFRLMNGDSVDEATVLRVHAAIKGKLSVAAILKPWVVSLEEKARAAAPPK